MALKKVKELPTGETGEYWKVTEATPNKMLNKLVCVIRLYKNKQAADEGKKPLGISHMFETILPESYKNSTVDELYAIAYATIKGSVSAPPTKFKQMVYNDLHGAEDV